MEVVRILAVASLYSDTVSPNKEWLKFMSCTNFCMDDVALSDLLGLVLMLQDVCRSTGERCMMMSLSWLIVYDSIAKNS